MPRATNGPATKARIKKVLKAAKGFRNSRSRTFQKAKEAVTKASKYAFRDRRARKRDFRSLWIVRINAACRAQGFTYGRLIDGLNKAGVEVDRKILAELAISDAAAFAKFVELAKEKVGQAAA